MTSSPQFQNVNTPPRHDVHNPNSTAGMAILRAYRLVYHAFGFKKGYSFPMYLITVGALMGFVLARLQYLSIEGIFFNSTIPGEVFWYQAGRRKVGITLHLIGVLLGGFLACLQFTPIIRHKAIWFHRICGYLAITLFLLGNAGAFMIMDHAIGGIPAMQVWIGVLGVATTVGLGLALVNIKRLQIDLHRAWMIRTWSWAANIITLRLIMLAGQHVLNTYSIQTYTTIRCDEIFWMYATLAGIPAAYNPTGKLYPVCGADAASNAAEVAVSSIGQGPENQAASLRIVFVMAAWLAITIHALLAELYLWLTPAESYRLRVVSYERQVEKGLRKRGQLKEAGLGSTRLGDAPEWWSIPTEDYQLAKQEMTGHHLDTTKPDYERQLGQPGVSTRSNRDGSDDTAVTMTGSQQ